MATTLKKDLFYIQIINKLREINENYEIVFENGVEAEDILIAYIK